MCGGSFRALFAKFLPHFTGPRGSYALIGLGAFLAGTTRAPLTAVFLLFEMTREYQITIPALLSSILSLVVARAIESKSIDSYSLAREGKSFHIGQDRLLLMQTPVTTAMNPDPDVVEDNEVFAEVLRKSAESSQVNLLVVSPERKFVGIVVIRELLSLVTSRDDLARIAIAADIYEMDSPIIDSSANLDEALRTMEAEGIEELPVLVAPDDKRLVGLLSRSAIQNALNRAAVSIVTGARSDNAIEWSADYRIVQIRVGAGISGISLRQLDPRSRFGVNIVAIKRASPEFSGVGGRRVKVERPRARSITGHEVRLPSWQTWSSRDPLDERAFEQMVLGVSTRR
jgi:CBS domain-containing protein